jgi:hypothetical protein
MANIIGLGVRVAEVVEVAVSANATVSAVSASGAICLLCTIWRLVPLSLRKIAFCARTIKFVT